MRDSLPEIPLKDLEIGVINLDDESSTGSHWTCYIKCNNTCDYFDSFGNLSPPLEFMAYMKDIKIHYNYKKYQEIDDNSIVCGHLCLLWLYKKYVLINSKSKSTGK